MSGSINKRHVAKIANTDQRCIVIMMQIPDREDHALVIPVEALPPRLEQAVMQVLESQEGQADEMLANVLSRRKLPDDPNGNILGTLHNKGYLTAVPVHQVIMFPRPNMPFPLIDILRQLGRYDSKKLPTIEELSARDKFNTHAHNIATMSVEQRINMAKGLLIDAQLLEKDVNAKKEKAYQLAPELRPRVVEVVNTPEFQDEYSESLPVVMNDDLINLEFLNEPSEEQSLSLDNVGGFYGNEE